MANGLIALFTDTVRETSETALRIREGYRNLISKAHYTSNYLLGGRSEEDVIHTGPVIRETLYLKLESTGKRFGGPGLTFDWTNKQTGTKVTAQMSYYANFIAWDELEIDLNADSAMGKEYIRAKFNDILRGKFQNLMMDTIEQFEDEKWAPADYAAMRTNYTAPMSIPYFITEETDGIPLQIGGDASPVTDVLGVSTATYPTWDNVRTTYGALGGALATGDDLIGRLLLAAQKTHFEALPMSPEHGELESMPNVVFCSDQGLSNVTSAMRAGQDTWGRRELSHLGVVLDNMVFKNITALNTATLYDNAAGNALVAETAADLTGPRYWGVSKASFKCLFMRDRYMAPDDPVQLTADGKPNDWVQVYKTYNQLLCLDRRRNFICSPSTDL